MVLSDNLTIVKKFGKEGNSGYYTIQREETFVNNTTFPTTRLSVNATGNVVVTKAESKVIGTREVLMKKMSHSDFIKLIQNKEALK